MSDKPTPKDVRLIITSCAVGYQGTNKRGEEYTIYEIGACLESGAPITDKKMRSFEDLPVAPQPIDLTVVPFNSEKHGLSFTLSRKGKAKGGSTQRINEIQQQLTDVDERLKRVEEHLRGRAPQQAPAAAPVVAAPAATTPPAEQQESLDQRFGAEPPY